MSTNRLFHEDLYRELMRSRANQLRAGECYIRLLTLKLERAKSRLKMYDIFNTIYCATDMVPSNYADYVIDMLQHSNAPKNTDAEFEEFHGTSFDIIPVGNTVAGLKRYLEILSLIFEFNILPTQEITVCLCSHYAYGCDGLYDDIDEITDEAQYEITDELHDTFIGYIMEQKK
jgi:hypothetical protein